MSIIEPTQKSQQPKILYKYRDFKNPYHISSVYNSEIYIPSANEFNDPHDSRLPFRYNVEELTEENIYKKCLELARYNFPQKDEQAHQTIAFEMQQKKLLWDDHHLANFDKQHYESICLKFGIFCLTPVSDNFLMWSYYSNSHTGFSIGYNTNLLVGSKIFGSGGPVIYSSEFPKVPLFSASEEPTLMFTLFHTKWDVWQHEKEFRLRHIYKNGKIQKIPIEFISEIILGAMFDENEKINFVGRLIKIYPHIKVIQLKLKNNEFGLEQNVIYDPRLFLGL